MAFANMNGANLDGILYALIAIAFLGAVSMVNLFLFAANCYRYRKARAVIVIIMSSILACTGLLASLSGFGDDESVLHVVTFFLGIAALHILFIYKSVTAIKKANSAIKQQEAAQ